MGGRQVLSPGPLLTRRANPIKQIYYTYVNLDLANPYWDGLFSDNPPIRTLIRPDFVGVENIPTRLGRLIMNNLLYLAFGDRCPGSEIDSNT